MPYLGLFSCIFLNGRFILCFFPPFVRIWNKRVDMLSGQCCTAMLSPPVTDSSTSISTWMKPGISSLHCTVPQPKTDLLLLLLQYIILLFHLMTETRRIRKSRWGVMRDKGHQHCGHKSFLLRLLSFTPLLMKPAVPTNKHNECLRYQAIIAGRCALCLITDISCCTDWTCIMQGRWRWGEMENGWGGLLYSICWDSSCGKAVLSEMSSISYL